MKFIKFGRFKIYFNDENLYNQIKPIWDEIQNLCELNNIKIKSILHYGYLEINFNDKELLHIIFEHEFNDFEYHKNNRKIYINYTFFPNLDSKNIIKALNQLKKYISNNLIKTPI